MKTIIKNGLQIIAITIMLTGFGIYFTADANFETEKPSIWSQCYKYATDISDDIWNCVHWLTVFKKEFNIDLDPRIAYQLPIVIDSEYAGQS